MPSAPRNILVLAAPRATDARALLKLLLLTRP
jgi:hypothetical protein